MWCLNGNSNDFSLSPAAAYSAPQPGAQGYTQPGQAYGTSSYASTTSTTTGAPPATQASYGTQPGFTAQSAYSGYSQQAATTPQRYSRASCMSMDMVVLQSCLWCICVVGVPVLPCGC